MRNPNNTARYYFLNFLAAKICYYRRKKIYFTGEIYAKFARTILEEKAAKTLVDSQH
jgi:hypothetical protein